MANAADDPMADEARVEDAFTQEITDYSYVPRYHVLSWMETVEGMVAGVAALPPVYLILNRDLLETGWGWKRLVPYRPGYVEWHVFKKYLGDYFDHNREAFLCAEQKPDPFGWIIAKKSALIAAAKLVLQAMVQMGVLVPTGDMTVVRRTAQFFLNSFQECLTAQRKEREMATAELGFKKQLTKEEKFEKRKQRLAAIGEDLLAIAADQPFRFPATFTFVVRAFSVLDGTGKGLDPRFHITEIAKPNAKELLRFNDAGVEIVVKASFNIWSKLLTYLYDSTSPKG
ncbi:protein ACTIVITY OF BC1 COMPLEX KINASE 8, chloroplastic isoform X10 [Zea mays]|nr:protein ACTIVITY OF BC1 COMPLEX KINASE 8, chloroplastic isoform X10 [Zea mays]